MPAARSSRQRGVSQYPHKFLRLGARFQRGNSSALKPCATRRASGFVARRNERNVAARRGSAGRWHGHAGRRRSLASFGSPTIAAITRAIPMRALSRANRFSTLFAISMLARKSPKIIRRPSHAPTGPWPAAAARWLAGPRRFPGPNWRRPTATGCAPLHYPIVATNRISSFGQPKTKFLRSTRFLVQIPPW